jgi:ABC-type transport system involved in cytochrome bd biosynthesis fused ATPase/permease subunit
VARVDFQRISKSYPGLKVLDDITLSIQSGEFFTLLGPSGCGKTTLLRTIAGFNKQDDGQVLVDGRRIDGVPAHRRNIGMVYQDYAIFPHLRTNAGVAELGDAADLQPILPVGAAHGVLPTGSRANHAPEPPIWRPRPGRGRVGAPCPMERPGRRALAATRVP